MVHQIVGRKRIRQLEKGLAIVAKTGSERTDGGEKTPIDWPNNGERKRWNGYATENRTNSTKKGKKCFFQRLPPFRIRSGREIPREKLIFYGKRNEVLLLLHFVSWPDPSSVSFPVKATIKHPIFEKIQRLSSPVKISLSFFYSSVTRFNLLGKFNSILTSSSFPHFTIRENKRTDKTPP